MRIVVSGASGLLGSALVPALRADGHAVVTLVRREPRGPDEARWDPDGGQLDASVLAGVDAVVHLAGAGIGDHRWTESYRQKILDSRVHGTRLLAGALAARRTAGEAAGDGGRPVVLLSASGTGWYGVSADEPVDESAPAGTGFLADVVRAWEAATAPAADAGVRVCLLRSGVVLAGRGGVLARQLPLFRLGVGGRLGSGRQWVSWISLDDWVAAARFLLAEDGQGADGPAADGPVPGGDHGPTGGGATVRAVTGVAVAGPVNLVAPGAVTGAEFARTLGAVLRRPAILPVPRLALRAVVGGLADEAALASQRVVPRVLTDAGYQFHHPELAGALRAVLSR
ncbi:epimerase [Pseudofrankia inefficax]|uniref:NAD-dependent epimerase/dehydratase n=1 Tax=Pseudofrankia inefficax (strain DSM 45817 / CECT 9037 / DDB 130130 / EuI1c) TaxID=298654 RepID=E3JBE4_PSEI1|nr:DUF1731 domain-containing protein [Pseudofrankia inefficax]ADP79816.1 domain of unknown function DUF1731 [Pseudofrankia inefficax]